MTTNGQESAVTRIVDSLPSDLPAHRRFIIAIAGAPASGKSTLASAVVDALDGTAGLLAMDGFHFDDSILTQRGDISRKGAPHTFDVASYEMTLRTLRDSPNVEQSVPVFDRELELSRNCASIVSTDHRVIVTEGNYLLLEALPWSSLRELFDATVWLDVPMETIGARIYERWLAAGYPPNEIERRAEDNDLPNARLVNSESIAADIVV